MPRAREVEGERREVEGGRREEHFGLGIGDWGLRMELLRHTGLEFEFMEEVERSGMRGSRGRADDGGWRFVDVKVNVDEAGGRGQAGSGRRRAVVGGR